MIIFAYGMDRRARLGSTPTTVCKGHLMLKLVGNFGSEVLGRLTKSSKPFNGEGCKLEVIMVTDGIPIFGSLPKASALAAA
mmetsp:Transcript_4204/g.17835  ORF Transcript_4204/g.17835 Transcript_4204/m.17835 type:complete len:81 (+) Transcript_4204:55-297(+)